MGLLYVDKAPQDNFTCSSALWPRNICIRPRVSSLRCMTWTKNDSLWPVPWSFLVHSYANALLSLKLEVLSQGQDNLSWNEIQNCIDMVNIEIQEENDRKYGMLSFSRIVGE